MEVCRAKKRSFAVNQRGLELIAHGTQAFPVVCYRVDFSVEKFQWHWHDELEFGLVTEGEIKISIGGSSYQLGTGDAYFVNSDILHAGAASGSGACILDVVVFHPLFVGGDTDSILWLDYVRPLMENQSLPGMELRHENPAHGTIIGTMKSVWKCYMEQAPGYPFRVRNGLSDVLFGLISLHSTQDAVDAKYFRSNQRMHKMLEFISRNYADAITLQDIASSASISPSECLRCFRSVIQTTPIQYLRDYRIQQAANRLKTSSALVSEIARQCGFLEMSYFSKVFREKYACSPLEYRKNNSI